MTEYISYLMQSFSNIYKENIFMAFAYFIIENIILYLGILILFKIYNLEKRCVLKKIVFCLVLSTYTLLFRFTINYALYKLVFIILTVIFGKVLLKTNSFQGAYISVKLEIIILCLEVILKSIFEQNYDNIIYTLEFELASKLLLLATMMLLLYIFVKRNVKINLDFTNMKNNKLDIFNLVCFLIILTQILKITYLYSSVPNYLIVYNTALTFIVYLVLCNNIKQNEKIKISKNSIRALKKYNSNLIKANNDMRCFKHDFNNIMQAIEGYIKLNDYKGLKVYFNDLLLECNLMKNLKPINITEMYQTEIYNLILRKSEKAKKNNIKFDLVALMDFKSLNNINVNISKIVENMLDNAIKISAKSIEKNITVNCMYDKKYNRNIILVLSSFEPQDEKGLAVIGAKSSFNRHKNSRIYSGKVRRYYNKCNSNFKYKTNQKISIQCDSKNERCNPLNDLIINKEVKKSLKKSKRVKMFLKFEKNIFVQELRIESLT